MSIYIIVSVLSSLFAEIAAKCYDKNKLVFIISFSLFLLFPSIIEGCRDWYIGEDMQAYGSYGFYNSLRYNNLLTYLSDESLKEPGFYVICYYCGKVGPINFYMFVAAFIKMMMLGLTCIRFRKTVIVWLAVLGYMLVFYWYGFSLMRQSLALSICLFSTTFLFNKRYVGFITCVVIAYFFHNSSVFVMTLPLLMSISKLKKRLSLVILASIIVYLFASVLFVSIATSGLFGEEMLERYENSGVNSSKTLLLMMAVFFLCSYLYKSKDETIKFYVQSFSVVALLLLGLAGYFAASFRIAFYFIMPLLFLITYFIKTTEHKTGRLLISICLICMYFLHFYVAGTHGLAGTVPYKSIILNLIL